MTDGVKKIFVLDTSVLVHDPNCVYSFEDNDVVIPITSIEELDGLKSTHFNAREAIRVLNGLMETGSLQRGVELPGGGTLRVELNSQLSNIPKGLKHDIKDNRILSVAITLQKNEQKNKRDYKPVIMVTKDFNLRIKAGAVGLKTEDYKTDKVDLGSFYKGWVEHEVDTGAEINAFVKSGHLKLRKGEFLPNQFIILKYDRQSALGVYDAQKNEVRKLFIYPNREIPVFKSIKGENLEQQFALNLLLDDKIELVTMVGKAGSGKTLLALLAGLTKATEENKYKRILIARPIVTFGKDVGFLPGELREKLDPWMAPIYDNLEKIYGDDFHFAKSGPDIRYDNMRQQLEDQELLEVAALPFIRGRSIPRQYFIIDEAQNLTPHEVKTIITRAGDGTKIILTGDIWQIDNPYLDAESNGLSHVVDRFKGQPTFGHIMLEKSERSPLAELAAQLL